MVEVKLEYEGKRSMQAIADDFKSQLSQKEIMKTAAYTLNQTANRVVGFELRSVTKLYTAKRKDLKDSIKVSKKASGTQGGLYASLSYTYKGISMYKFKNKGLDTKLGFVTYRKKIKGVQVEIKKGKTTLLKHAFIKTMPNGHRGIWMHGSYTGGKFVPEDVKTSKGKPKISEMKTASPFGMLTSNKMTSELRAYIDKNLPERFRILLQNKVNKLKK